jgi:hypothetical protein
MFKENNDYGCTRYSGISDMTITDNGSFLDQLKKSEIDYKQVILNIGSYAAEPCYLLHYESRKTNLPMTVLVFPQVGSDSWAEDYYYFPHMTENDAKSLNWGNVLEHIRSVVWETIRAKIPVAIHCSHCGKFISMSKSDIYEDIRGNKRCGYCHNILS